MALKDTIKHLKDLIAKISHDIEKADNGNKAASQRVRTATVKLEKTAKTYRKESIKHEKSNKGVKKTAAKKTTKKTKTQKPAQPKAQAKQVKKPAKAKTLKAKSKAKTLTAKTHKTKAHKTKARPLSFKKPSAKLLTKRSH